MTDKTHCEYCGLPLPLSVDKVSRRVRSYHFQRCEKRPRAPEPEPVPLVDLNDPDVRQYLVEQGWAPPSPEMTTCNMKWCANMYEKGRGACPFCGCKEPD